MNHRHRVVLIGAGNVAWHLAAALGRVADVVGVYGRNGERASEVARRAGAKVFPALSKIPRDADFYIMAVADDAIAAVAAQMPPVAGVVAHTSGSVDAGALVGVACRGYGSFYPLQTFTWGRDVDMSVIPFFIEGSDEHAFQRLKGLARMVSPSVYEANSDIRACLHLAAVVSSNFANALLGESAEILRRSGLPLDVLRPLMAETMAKAFDLGPAVAQTGPARRGDMQVLEKQRHCLNEPMATIYLKLSELIVNQQEKCQK